MFVPNENVRRSAMAGAADAIGELLKQGADASVTDNCGRTALECAKLVAMSPGNATPQATWDDIFTQVWMIISRVEVCVRGCVHRDCTPV